MIATGLQIIDNVLLQPMEYRQRALGLQFRSYDFGHCVFHGIAIDPLSDSIVPQACLLALGDPSASINLSFFRKSPRGQTEPHFIHTDVDMGDWSALLYLNPDPPPGDGTTFWRHIESGETENLTPHLRSIEGNDPSKWEVVEHVEAKFNRLVVFPASFYHSRAIFDNWGTGNDARLVQVVFGKANK